MRPVPAQLVGTSVRTTPTTTPTPPLHIELVSAAATFTAFFARCRPSLTGLYICMCVCMYVEKGNLRSLCVSSPLSSLSRYLGPSVITLGSVLSETLIFPLLSRRLNTELFLAAETEASLVTFLCRHHHYHERQTKGGFLMENILRAHTIFLRDI